MVFRSHGGDDAEWNLVTVCDRCHTAIHAYKLIIMPLKEGEPIDASKGVRWHFTGGWTP